jgi:holo-[acyl-carrier protein] synthase
VTPPAATVMPLIGIDLVHVPTLRALIEGPGGAAFLAEGWRPSEQVACGGSPTTLAVTWAAKEATLKALGVGISQVPLLDVEVLRQDGEPPKLRLHGEALSRARVLGDPALTISLSHESNLAVAVVCGYVVRAVTS